MEWPNQRHRKETHSSERSLSNTGKESRILGSVIGGYDGHRGNFYYFDVYPKHQGNGYEKLLLKTLEI